MLGSDGEERRLDGSAGGVLWAFRFSFLTTKRFPLCYGFNVSFSVNCCGMQLSYSSRQKEGTSPELLHASLIKQEGKCGAALEYFLNLFSAVELVSHAVSAVRSLSWALKCVSKHRFGDQFLPLKAQ